MLFYKQIGSQRKVKRARLTSNGKSQLQIRNGTLQSSGLHAEAQTAISVGRLWRVSDPVSSQPGMWKVYSPMGGGKRFCEGGGAPKRCREQTRRIQLHMDKVAHKMLLQNQFGLRGVQKQKQTGGRLKPQGQLLSRGLTRHKTHW